MKNDNLKCKIVNNKEIQIKKWGNNNAVIIPKSITSKLKLKVGDFVSIFSEREGIVIRPQRRRKYKLKDLLKGIDPSNIHKEVDWGKPVGKEIW